MCAHNIEMISGYLHVAELVLLKNIRLIIMKYDDEDEDNKYEKSNKSTTKLVFVNNLNWKSSFNAILSLWMKSLLGLGSGLYECFGARFPVVVMNAVTMGTRSSCE